MKHCAVTLAIEKPVSDHNTPVCKVYHVNLKEFADTFKGMRHTGSALKKRKLNPLGREEVLTHDRNLSAQNAWLLANFVVFDDFHWFL